eukprot:CAMPEP_0194135114 /NCGR_PEP_ID=MMETSP0152-20130528/5192_1 /TAXON_ID=1049557 /ORGANISM="Thalassiothrix antarctica, Strain L6-D1" /LENGTH=837 /DNA_ID=CAMNT_0038831179 /DNA_START=248 /DNA_END=2761 /DNA_ORIENTATION=+
MSVVGIDFGVKNSLIAAAGRGGVDVVLNGNSNRLNPCMVGFDQARSMGEGAAISATSNFKNTISSMKRLVGLEYTDPRAQNEMKKCSFSCVPIKHATGPDSVGVKVSLNGEEMLLPIEAVAGMMLKHLGNIAGAKAARESNVNDDKDVFPTDWVIAIPGYYSDSQRRALLVGCKIVGITGVLRLMHEHTAVALSYGIFKDLKKEFAKDEVTNILFIDMGDSCYTASLIAFETGKLAVKSCFFDENLGGRDFDEVIAQWLANKFEEKFKGKLSAKPMEKPKVRIKLLAAAEKAKKTLSPQGVKEARISLECLMDDFDFSVTLKTAEYESMIQPLLDRLKFPVEKVLEETKLAASDLASVEVVGGSSRIGAVKKTLLSVLGVSTLSTTMNADEAVARGAALQSAILSPRFKVLPYEIQEAQPYPIKLSWEDDGAEQQSAEAEAAPTNSVVMFDRGLNFPIVRRVTLKRAGNFSVKCSYNDSVVGYGLHKDVKKDICSFTIQVPEGEQKKVRVNVRQDIHGIINLSSGQMVEEIEEEQVEVKEGEEPKEGEKKEGEKKEGEKKEEEKKEVEEKKKKVKKTLLEFTTNRHLDWTKDEIEKLFETEVSMANADRIVRQTADMRNELESYIYSMRDKITSESGLAPFTKDDEKNALSDLLGKTENWLYEDGFDAIKSVYGDKLGDLRRFGNPIELRASESAARPGAIQNLKQKIEMYQQWINESQGKEEYAHITDEERQTCHSKCDETSSWMYGMMDKQGSLALNDDPVVKVSEIQAKTQDIIKVCSGIKHKPKPAPPKVEKKVEEPPQAKDEKKEEEPQPMETEEIPKENQAEPMETEKIPE